jgi:hypothetical protein
MGSRLATLLGVALLASLAGGALAARLAEPTPTVVGVPPFGPPVQGAPWGRRVGFELVSSRRFDPGSVPYGRSFPGWAPRTRAGQELVVVATQPGTTFLGYGDAGGPTRTLVAVGPARRPKAIYDVTSLGRPAAHLWPLELRWARQVGKTLYIASAHRTYAATTGGRNGYLTAVAAASGRIVWQSPALVANADGFAIVGDVIVTGYGFTREPDFLYALDRRTGAVLARLAVPSAPERIAARGTTLFVRTYDHRLVVRLRAG